MRGRERTYSFDGKTSKGARANLLAIVPLVAMVCLTACASDSRGPSASASPDTTARSVDGDVPPPGQDYLEALTRRFMLDDPPDDARFERYISPDEFGEVMVECYMGQGIPARLSTDGGVLVDEIPTEQTTLQREAAYRCWVRFPTHPRYEEPLSREQLRVLYEYKVGELTECLEAEGFEVPPPPTVEVFIASYENPDTPMWDPYPGTDPRARERWEQLNQVCPQSPPLDVLYGDR